MYVLWCSVGDYNESDYAIIDWDKRGDNIEDTKKAEINTKWNFSFMDKFNSMGYRCTWGASEFTLLNAQKARLLSLHTNVRKSWIIFHLADDVQPKHFRILMVPSIKTWSCGAFLSQKADVLPFGGFMRASWWQLQQRCTTCTFTSVGSYAKLRILKKSQD